MEAALQDPEYKLRSILRNIERLATTHEDELPAYKHVLTLRNDCRAIQIFYRDVLLSDEHGTSISHIDVDKYLVECEAKFSVETYNASRSFEEQVQLLIDLMVMKDKALYTLASSLLKQVGVDYVIPDSSNTSTDLCSSELTKLFSLCRTCRYLGKTIKRIEITREDVVASMEVMSKQHLISKLQEQLRIKNEELSSLRLKFTLINKEVGKEQLIMRLQEQAESAEAASIKLRGEMEGLNVLYRKKIQAEAKYKDELSSHQAEILRLSNKINGTLSSLRNAVEKELSASQSREMECKEVKTEVSLLSSRISLLEQQAEEARVEKVQLQAALKASKAQARVDAARLKDMESQRDRWQKLSLIMSAAKRNSDDICSAAEQKSNESERKCKEWERTYDSEVAAHLHTKMVLEKALSALQREKDAEAESALGMISSLTKQGVADRERLIELETNLRISEAVNHRLFSTDEEVDDVIH